MLLRARILALEAETALLQRAINASLIDPDKGKAALTVFAQLQRMGAQFTFGEFLVERGLLTSTVLEALLQGSEANIRAVSKVGEFELLQIIGEGSNGTVFKAMQTSLQRPVAIKVLKPEFASDPIALKRFVAEARATARLSHPNVVRGFMVGEDQGLYYYAMELVDGGSARAMLDSRRAKGLGGLETKRALELVKQVADGLGAAHAEGMVHRDIKPENILMTSEGVAKLADLGIAGHALSIEDDNSFWGSPPYVAPEVIRGETIDDPRSDLYSLGATLFELLTGYPPYVAPDPHEVMRMHVASPVPDPRQRRPELDAAISQLVKRLLSKHPQDRPAGAEAISEAITRILSPDAKPAPPPKPQHAPNMFSVVQGQRPTSRPPVPQQPRSVHPAVAGAKPGVRHVHPANRPPAAGGTVKKTIIPRHGSKPPLPRKPKP